ncbi:anthranilate phosphoribosyltransferase [Psychrobacter lutiphocae]|uniref:anthranilate phosphoribosyltransferase n=1 Tax=Psychrobacter lutiphocae TaxID=540500 RepID=UPI0003649F07|nr:anthranilate phosphoribosyltransferase [Psychrobacter lutiphocae]
MTNDTPLRTASLTDDQIHDILTTALARIVRRIDLTQQEMRQIMTIIMDGRCPDAMMGALLTGLNMKSESIDEITASASVMLDFALKIEPKGCHNLVDIVGTGGDGSNLFNVSTASAFVAAAAGATVAKHGNRGVSSKSGSSDLLEKAGIDLNISLDQARQCIEQKGVGFLFAPNHHTAMKYAIPVRRALKVRTIFNILGPLTNPAGVKNSVIGVFTDTLCEPLAHVLKNLGAEHVMVVGSKDRLDEISLATSTKVAELKNGEVTVYDIYPEDAGIDSQTLVGLEVNSSTKSLQLIQAALSGKDSNDFGIPQTVVNKARDMIALNAGAAIYVSGLASNLPNGVNQAQTIIQRGDGLKKMQQLAEFTQSFSAN